jgi:phage terminase small subunit
MLSAKQRKFAEEYIVDLSGPKAAARAGFSQRSARQHAYRLLRNPEVAELINELMSARAERTRARADQVVRELVELAFADASDVVQFVRLACPSCYPAEAKDIQRLPREDCEECFGDGVGLVQIRDTRTLVGGAKRLFDGIRESKEGIEVKLRDRTKALELLGRHLGMFNDKLQIVKPKVHVKDWTGRKRGQKNGDNGGNSNE